MRYPELANPQRQSNQWLPQGEEVERVCSTDRHLIGFFWGQNDKDVELYSSDSGATLNVLKIHFKNG